MPTRAGFLLAAATAALLPASAAAAPEVVVSIKPIHALVAGVMRGVGEPKLLVTGAGSPHSYSLRPSQARALSAADLLVWVGPEMETFLERPIAGLAEKATVLELGTAEGMAFLETRDGGAWEPDQHGAAEADDHGHEDHGHEDHDHEDHGHEDHADDEHGHDDHAKDEHDHAEHGHGEHNLHIWLDPDNAAAIVRATVAALSRIDPDQAVVYAGNGKALVAELGALDAELRRALADVADQPYVVFHDAYHYFEAHYGLSAVGSITVSPERAPGAKRLREIRGKITELGATCVFSEPQFEPALVATVIEGTEARTGTLDPLGAGIEAGEGAYPALMRALADGLIACLKPAS